MSKYYTPTIDEFHVGFECEYQDIDNGMWGKFNHPDLDSLPLNDSIEYTRVKYLDKEDIESLGFKFEGGKLIRNRGDNYNYKEYSLYHRGIDNRVIIGEYGNCIFLGEIKNKSELKKLLKQLKIIE